MKIKDHQDFTTIFRTYFPLCLSLHNDANCIMQIYNRYFQFITYVGRLLTREQIFCLHFESPSTTHSTALRARNISHIPEGLVDNPHLRLNHLCQTAVNRYFFFFLGGGGGAEGKTGRGRI